jgi:hypothetical protein
VREHRLRTHGVRDEEVDLGREDALRVRTREVARDRDGLRRSSWSGSDRCGDSTRPHTWPPVRFVLGEMVKVPKRSASAQSWPSAEPAMARRVKPRRVEYMACKTQARGERGKVLVSYVPSRLLCAPGRCAYGEGPQRQHRAIEAGEDRPYTSGEHRAAGNSLQEVGECKDKRDRVHRSSSQSCDRVVSSPSPVCTSTPGRKALSVLLALAGSPRSEIRQCVKQHSNTSEPASITTARCRRRDCAALGDVHAPGVSSQVTTISPLQLLADNALHGIGEV